MLVTAVKGGSVFKSDFFVKKPHIQPEAALKKK